MVLLWGVAVSAASLRLFLPKFWQIPGMNLKAFLRQPLNSGICQNFTRHTATVKTPLYETATPYSKTKRTRELQMKYFFIFYPLCNLEVAFM